MYECIECKKITDKLKKNYALNVMVDNIGNIKKDKRKFMISHQ